MKLIDFKFYPKLVAAAKEQLKFYNKMMDEKKKNIQQRELDRGKI